jgi:hypothetical protein
MLSFRESERMMLRRSGVVEVGALLMEVLERCEAMDWRREKEAPGEEISTAEGCRLWVGVRAGVRGEEGIMADGSRGGC